MDTKIHIKEKKKLLQNLLFKYIDKDLYSLSQTAGNIDTYFIELDENIKDLNEYNIKNKRDLCKTNIDKKNCNENSHCKWKSNNCKLVLNNEAVIKFVNKIVHELIKDEMKSKEILSIDNYYVSDIVDINNFTQRNKENIIKSDIPNINKILSQIFGEENILPKNVDMYDREYEYPFHVITGSL